jgi:hypothetical protein
VNTQPYNAVTEFFAFAEDLLLSRTQSVSKQGQHTLRSSITNGTTIPSSSPQVPTVRPPLREALYTMGPNGPLFTSIASRDIASLITNKLPPSLTLPTSTGGTFTASSTSIVPNNPVSTMSRTLAESLRKRASFPHRKRHDFSEDNLGKLQSTKWLDWGSHASFAPQWDDGGVGGGFGAESITLDWAYKRLRREKRPKSDVKEEVVQEVVVSEIIDEKLLLEWEEIKPSKDLVDGELIVEDKEMSIDETLEGLRGLIILLGQLQTLRMATGKTEIPEDEKALGYTPSFLF